MNKLISGLRAKFSSAKHIKVSKRGKDLIWAAISLAALGLIVTIGVTSQPPTKNVSGIVRSRPASVIVDEPAKETNPATQDNSSEATAQSAVKMPDLNGWQACIPVLEVAAAEKKELWEQSCVSIASSLQNMARRISAREYAATATSLEAKGRYVADRRGCEKWLRNKFQDDVLSESDVVAVINAELQSLNTQMLEINRKILSDCGIYVELVAVPVDQRRFLPAGFSETVANTAMSATWESVQEMAVSTGVGLGSSVVAHSVTEALGARDENDPPTAGTQVAAFLAGLAAEFVTEAVISEVNDIDGRLALRVESLVGNQLMQLSSYESEWCTYATELVNNNEKLLFSALEKELGVLAKPAPSK
jgi:hypothetical protein